ncbi:hypothetical protein [Mesorhizobium sp. BR-1-1-10]|uniref:hypothetical protein n=1 Tax=Mesorhizobium sp. BR-1-1-10 TaxID=2876660 RepID=UPI001CD10120|nr:hypothetical protein [Mesorhizobium sp. BR-1-1-10]MBZ9978723.1 hypothetical protein [Mesorhizobium sp. BR-1-1-10]
MAYKYYTSCFLYPVGGKPYNEDDRLAFLAGQALQIIVITGLAAAFGLLLGPVGAALAAAIAFLASATATIDKAAGEWLNHRLVCLDKDNPKCAVGIVSYNPFRSDLGAFDNDQYFDVILMPHPTTEILNAETNEAALAAANRYNADGTVAAEFAASVAAHPANDILNDGFQGHELLLPRDDLKTDLGYAPADDHARWGLHCEAEGDFWIKMRQWAPAIVILLTAALVVTVAAAAAGASAGAAVGCAIGSFFLGALGCAIGSFLGGLLGAAIGGAIGGAASYFGGVKPVLQGLFNWNPGNVEDANVGDKALGPIRMGDHVAVLGEHVYDGYHKGWHEFHPLMAVVKFDAAASVDAKHYLQWDPDFADTGTVPPKPPGETTDLTAQDIRDGLGSAAFRARCDNLRRTWCAMLNEAFDPETKRTQQGLDQRWTIHPMVDGCIPQEQPPAPHIG